MGLQDYVNGGSENDGYMYVIHVLYKYIYMYIFTYMYKLIIHNCCFTLHFAISGMTICDICRLCDVAHAGVSRSHALATPTT